jgi:Organic solute transporter Ostalpha
VTCNNSPPAIRVDSYHNNGFGSEALQVRARDPIELLFYAILLLKCCSELGTIPIGWNNDKCMESLVHTLEPSDFIASSIRILYMPLVYAVISFFSYRFFREYTYYSFIEVGT